MIPAILGELADTALNKKDDKKRVDDPSMEERASIEDRRVKRGKAAGSSTYSPTTALGGIG